MNKKVKPFKQTVFLSEQCAICSLKSYSKCSKCSLSALGQARNRFATRLGLQCLSIISCSKSAQKFAVRVYQVATVAMENTQLVLSQFKNFLT